MGRRARFRGAKATPKSLEKDLLEKAKVLTDDPKVLFPSCDQGCKRCYFRKVGAKMEKVSKLRFNEKKLTKAMNRGDQLVRAYAATVSLGLAGKVPYLACSKTPVGEVSYAVRGNVERDKLIGVQHYDNPQLRLLALWDTAQKKDLHLYASEGKLSCSADGPKPPEDYVEEAMGQLPYDLDQSDSCGHAGTGSVLRVKWITPGITISVCSDCAEDVNSAHLLAGRIAAADPLDDFDVDIETTINCLSSCGECVAKASAALDRDLKKRYLKGEVTDKQLIDEHGRMRLEAIRASKKEVFLIGADCYGKDKDKFLERVRGSPVEKEALSGLIGTKKVCIISTTDQAATIITDLWSKYRDELLGQVASPEVVKELLAKQIELSPSQMVAEAKRMESSKTIEASLPKYQKLGPVGKFSDMLTRTYKTEGKEALLRQIEKSKGSAHKLHSVSFAFCAAVGEGQSRSWHFSKEEIDFGNYLAEFAKKLLDSKSDEYDDALRLLVTASGAVEDTVKA